MSNYESRRLERVTTAIRLSTGNDVAKTRDVARAVLKALRPRLRTRPVAWQARLRSGDGDWFEANYPDGHNDPEKFEYRPLFTDPF